MLKGSRTERLLQEEKGFTLAEVLVTMIIMMGVLFALYSIFDMSIRVFTFGNAKAEATDNSRLGLEKMAREIRAAYPYDKAASDPLESRLFDTWAAQQIRFGNDLDEPPSSGTDAGKRRIQCPNISTPPVCEKIGYEVYRLDPTNKPHQGTLGRDNTSTGPTNTAANLQPVVEYVDYDDKGTLATSDDDTGLRFTYCKTVTGSDTVSGDDCPTGFDVATSEKDIGLVRIDLRIRVETGQQNGTQTLTTDVALRNRGS